MTAITAESRWSKSGDRMRALIKKDDEPTKRPTGRSQNLVVPNSFSGVGAMISSFNAETEYSMKYFMSMRSFDNLATKDIPYVTVEDPDLQGTPEQVVPLYTLDPSKTKLFVNAFCYKKLDPKGGVTTFGNPKRVPSFWKFDRPFTFEVGANTFSADCSGKAARLPPYSQVILEACILHLNAYDTHKLKKNPTAESKINTMFVLNVGSVRQGKRTANTGRPAELMQRVMPYGDQKLPHVLLEEIAAHAQEESGEEEEEEGSAALLEDGDDEEDTGRARPHTPYSVICAEFRDILLQQEQDALVAAERATNPDLPVVPFVPPVQREDASDHDEVPEPPLVPEKKVYRGKPATPIRIGVHNFPGFRNVIPNETYLLIGQTPNSIRAWFRNTWEDIVADGKEKPKNSSRSHEVPRFNNIQFDLDLEGTEEGPEGKTITRRQKAIVEVPPWVATPSALVPLPGFHEWIVKGTKERPPIPFELVAVPMIDAEDGCNGPTEARDEEATDGLVTMVAKDVLYHTRPYLDHYGIPVTADAMIRQNWKPLNLVPNRDADMGYLVMVHEAGTTKNKFGVVTTTFADARAKGMARLEDLKNPEGVISLESGGLGSETIDNTTFPSGTRFYALPCRDMTVNPYVPMTEEITLFTQLVEHCTKFSLEEKAARIQEFEPPAKCSITSPEDGDAFVLAQLKHHNPSGVGEAKTLLDALAKGANYSDRDEKKYTGGYRMRQPPWVFFAVVPIKEEKGIARETALKFLESQKRALPPVPETTPTESLKRPHAETTPTVAEEGTAEPPAKKARIEDAAPLVDKMDQS